MASAQVSATGQPIPPLGGVSPVPGSAGRVAAGRVAAGRVAAGQVADPVILTSLGAAVGGRAGAATVGDTVGGVAARFVAAPASTAETSALQRVAASHGLGVVVRGSGTKLSWGEAPERVDLLLDTRSMAKVVEHVAGDLVVHVQAGVALDVLRSRLSAAGQRLAIDPMVGPDSPGSGTIGGLVSTAASGPLRLSHGAVRDLLIGVTIVRADGAIAKAGGKVVKNVAGFDLGKLVTGSWGTLGIVTEAVFRLHPAPDVSRWVGVSVPGAQAAHVAVQALIHSQLVPTAIEVDRPAAGPAAGVPGTEPVEAAGAVAVGVLVEGTAAGVDARVAGLRRLLGDTAQIADTAPRWWGRAPWGVGGTGLRLTHEIAGLQDLLDTIDRTGVPVSVRGSAAVGVLHAGLTGDIDAEVVARVVEDLRAASHRWGGDVVVLDAPPEVRAVVDGWGPVRGFALMERIKGLFDPERLLAPGRFVGGL